jgi:hypothetical protein
MTRFSSFLKENNPGGSNDSDRAGESGTQIYLLFYHVKTPRGGERWGKEP